MAHSGGFGFYKRASNSESSVDRKTQTSSGNSEQVVRTSERLVGSNNENMEHDLMNVSIISFPESLADEVIENVGNANLTAELDPSIFDTSNLSEMGKSQLTNGQLVKNRSMKDLFNLENDNVEIGVESISLEPVQSVESAAEALAAPPKSVEANPKSVKAKKDTVRGKKRAFVEAISLEPVQSVEDGNIESATVALAAPPKSVKKAKEDTVRGKKRAFVEAISLEPVQSVEDGNIESATVGKKRAFVEAISLEPVQSVEDGNIESATEALSAPPQSVKATVTVKELKHSLDVASKSVKKGKITPGQQVKNGRKNKEIKDIVSRVRLTRNKTPKNYIEITENDDICDSDEEFIPAERIVESEESDDDSRKQTRRGRPEGAKNKKSRKPTLVKDPSINDGENEEVNETGDIDKDGESGCKSPVKRTTKATKKRTVNEAQWVKNLRKKARAAGEAYITRQKKTGLMIQMPARPVGPDCTCNRECSKLIGKEGLQAIHDAHRALVYNMQTADLINKVKREPTKAERKLGADNPSRVKFMNTYQVTYQSRQYIVCKLAFCSMHGITESRIEDTDTVIPDQRGLKGNHNAISQERKQVVYEAIENLPNRLSHYT